VSNPHIDVWSLVSQPAPEPPDMVVSGLLAGTVGAIVAPGGVGKSWVAAQLLLQVATGKDVLGLGQVKTGSVAYFNAEDPAKMLEWRMWHMLQRLGPSVSALQPIPDQSARFHLAALMGHSPRLLDASGNRVQEWIDYVKSWSYGRRLVIIDTLRKFHGAEENASGPMTTLTQILDEIARDTGAAVLFCHHSNKLAMAEGKGDEAGASRGSSALVDNIRWQWNIVRMSQAEAKGFGVQDDSRKRWMKICGAKANYGEESKDLWLYKGINGVPEPMVLEKIEEKEKEKTNGKAAY